MTRFAADESAWRALPHEVSGWWRRRGASRLVEREGEWQVEGAAAGEARVAFAEPWTTPSVVAPVAAAGGGA